MAGAIVAPTIIFSHPSHKFSGEILREKIAINTIEVLRRFFCLSFLKIYMMNGKI
jgi:hypothetical protein